jgi:hypothetical protein
VLPAGASLVNIIQANVSQLPSPAPTVHQLWVSLAPLYSPCPNMGKGKICENALTLVHTWHNAGLVHS